MKSRVWHVLGAGSIGCLWAASLAEQGLPVEVILRDKRMASLPEQPHQLTLTHQEQSDDVSVSFTSPARISQSISRLIVCTKAQDALTAIKEVAHRLNKESRILLLQNGMGSQQAIAKAFPELGIWVGSVTDGAYLKSPFHVCHAGVGQTSIGPWSSNTQQDDFKELLSDFRLKVCLSAHIEQQLWNKLAINCCINGLTALFDCRNGELLDNGVCQIRLDELIDETGQLLNIYDIDNQLRENVYRVCRKTANNVSSTCQDARHKRTTELSYINNFLIKDASRRGLEAVVNRRLLDELERRNIH